MASASWKNVIKTNTEYCDKFLFLVIGCNQDLNMPSCKTVTWQAFGKLLSPCIERNGLGFGMETILNSVAWTYIYYY